jgi:hypothetical protein
MKILTPSGSAKIAVDIWSIVSLSLSLSLPLSLSRSHSFYPSLIPHQTSTSADDAVKDLMEGMCGIHTKQNSTISNRRPTREAGVSKTVLNMHTLHKNVTCKVLVPCLMSWNQRSQTFSKRTKSLFLSNVVRTFVSQQFSFAKIIHPTDRCGILNRALFARDK